MLAARYVHMCIQELPFLSLVRKKHVRIETTPYIYHTEEEETS